MSHPVLDSKDRRSYEHARQKHLHPSDRCTSRSNNYKYRVGNSKKEYLILRPSGVRWVDPMASDDLDSDLDYVGPYDGWDVDESHAAADIFPLEVSLTDLVRPPRKRKGEHTTAASHVHMTSFNERAFLICLKRHCEGL